MTVQLLSMQSAGTRQMAQIAVLRAATQMQNAAAEVLASKPAPAPPGTGFVVDKRA
ncbi:MAG: hypothetical protein ABI398_04770 [Devosia sp.]